MVLIQNILSAFFKIVKAGQPPGAPAAGDNDDSTLRKYRTHMNSLENLSVFVLTVVLAIAIGVSPAVVNWLAGLHVVARIAYWFAYYSGIGPAVQGPRTLTFAAGWFLNLFLVIAVLFKLL